MSEEIASQGGSKHSKAPECPYCGKASNALVSTKDFNRGTTDLTFTYYQCVSCRLVFMDPIPADMSPYYAGGYQPIPSSLAELRSIAEKERFRMEPILKHKKAGKLLEIGPWIGIFSCNAKDAGFDVTAIDIDQRCIDFLNSTVGIKAVQSSNLDATLSQMQETFDVIALWHCLEHLPRPWLVIQHAARRLNPGGILLIAIPNIESYEFSVLRERWRHLDAPRHLHFYPSESLEKLCLSNGLVTLERTTLDTLSDALSRDAWYHWAVEKFRVKYVRGLASLLGYRLGRRHATKNDAGSGITAVFQAPSSPRL